MEDFIENQVDLLIILIFFLLLLNFCRTLKLRICQLFVTFSFILALSISSYCTHELY